MSHKKTKKMRSYRRSHRRMKKHRGGDVSPTETTSIGETTQNALNSANDSIKSAEEKVKEQASSMFDGLSSWFSSSETPPATQQQQPTQPTQTAGRRRKRHRKSRRTRRR
jgi:hypothetical protein